MVNQYYQQGVPNLESLKLCTFLAEIYYEGVFVFFFLFNIYQN